MYIFIYSITIISVILLLTYLSSLTNAVTIIISSRHNYDEIVCHFFYTGILYNHVCSFSPIPLCYDLLKEICQSCN
jgi:hypothetical protein